MWLMIYLHFMQRVLLNVTVVMWVINKQQWRCDMQGHFPWILVELNSCSFSSSSASVVLLYLSRPSAPLPSECSAAMCPYGRALEMCGGFLLLSGANSSGHLPGLSLLACARLWSGLTDHSVEGHSSTCPPGQEPGWNNSIQLQPPHIYSLEFLILLRTWPSRFQKI